MMKDMHFSTGEEEPNHPNDYGLIVYRLARVEKTVESIEANLKIITEIQSDVKKNTWRIDNLEKSRERTMAALTVLGTSVFLLFIQQIFKILGAA